MYCHTKNYEIRYSDVDFEDNIKLSSLLGIMQESACLSAEELGFGYSTLQSKNYGFILVNWYVEMLRPVVLGEVITVKTWPIKPKKLIVFRDFEFYVGDEKVGVASSRWCLVDLKTFTMIPASLACSESIVYNENRSIEGANFKISDLAAGEISYEKIISYSDCDHYNHANNTKYGDLLIDALTLQELSGKWISAFKITYTKQCKYGEKLSVSKVWQSDGSCILLGAVDGEARASMQIWLNDKV